MTDAVWLGRKLWQLMPERADKLFFALLVLAIVLLPFPQLTGVKNSAIFGLLAYLLYRGYQTPQAVVMVMRRHKAVALYGGFLLVAVLSSLIAPNPMGNLQEFKADLLKQTILGAGVLYFATRGVQGRFWILLVLWSYVARSLYVAGEFIYHGQIILAGNPLYRELETVSHGYALEISTLFPLLLALLFLEWNVLSRLTRVAMTAMALFAGWALLQNESTTPVVFVLTTLILLGLLRLGRLRGLVLLLIGGTLISLVVSIPALRDRLVTHHWQRLVAERNWEGDQAFNNRGLLWSGYMELIDQRPWLGHGIGLRKTAILIPEQAKTNPVLHRLVTTQRCAGDPDPFIAQCDRYPHNTYLGILFQAGYIGLLLWIGALGMLLVALLRQRTPTTLALALFWGFFLIGAVLNGLWNGVIGKELMVLAAAGVALTWSRTPSS